MHLPPALSLTGVFRLILYWKRILISGSSLTGNAPSLQAHLVLDNSGSCYRVAVHVECTAEEHHDDAFLFLKFRCRSRPGMWPRRTVSVPYRASLRSEEHTSELQSPCNLVC